MATNNFDPLKEGATKFDPTKAGGTLVQQAQPKQTDMFAGHPIINTILGTAGNLTKDIGAGFVARQQTPQYERMTNNALDLLKLYKTETDPVKKEQLMKQANDLLHQSGQGTQEIQGMFSPDAQKGGSLVDYAKRGFGAGAEIAGAADMAAAPLSFGATKAGIANPVLGTLPAANIPGIAQATSFLASKVPGAVKATGAAIANSPLRLLTQKGVGRSIGDAAEKATNKGTVYAGNELMDLMKNSVMKKFLQETKDPDVVKAMNKILSSVRDPEALKNPKQILKLRQEIGNKVPASFWESIGSSGAQKTEGKVAKSMYGALTNAAKDVIPGLRPLDTTYKLYKTFGSPASFLGRIAAGKATEAVTGHRVDEKYVEGLATLAKIMGAAKL